MPAEDWDEECFNFKHVYWHSEIKLLVYKGYKAGYAKRGKGTLVLDMSFLCIPQIGLFISKRDMGCL